MIKLIYRVLNNQKNSLLEQIVLLKGREEEIKNKTANKTYYYKK